jgi:protein-S-isoprenylcysteine O-methyltransferase Ste14
LVWIIGAFYNSLKAPSNKQKRFRFDWIILMMLIWLINHYIPKRYWLYMTFHLSWLQMAGTVLLIVSMIVTLWARWELGKMWASIAAVKEDHQLITDEPYQITRHPIYTGVLGMILGSAFSLGEGSIFLGFLMILFVFLNRIRIEEEMMTNTFGDQYEKYKQRVPRLLPSIKWRTMTQK